MPNKLKRKVSKPIAAVAPPKPTPEDTKDNDGAFAFQDQSIRQFASRLNDLMLAAGLNQSQLAAAVFGTTKDHRGYTVARGRDRISNYLRGRDVPRTQNLAKIAKVFKLSVQELAPELTQTLDKSETISMRVIAGQPDRAQLLVNVVVPLTVAAQVIALLGTPKPKDD